MANTALLNATQLDYVALRSSLKTFLSSQDRYRDYDFEGANFSVLLDLLAYNGWLESWLMNMVASEMFLDTARLQDSLWSHSKELNYVPRSVTSARAEVVVTIDDEGLAPSSITIPAGWRVSAEGTDEEGTQQQFSFSTRDAVVVRPNEVGAYVSGPVEVWEGEPVTEVFVVNSHGRFVLQSQNCSVDSIRVWVQASSTDFSNVEFQRAYNLFGVKADDPVYYVQGAYEGRYEISFGDGSVGRAVSNGNLVRVEYLDSSGSSANGLRRFNPAQDVETFDGISVSTETPAHGGAEREDVESVRYFAPRHFSTQERAVTKDDFITAVRERFPTLQDVIAYGGEEVVPKRYGKVIISAKPYGDTVLTNALKNDVIAYLTGKNIVTEPEFQDAIVLYVKASVAVDYDRRVTTKSASQIAALARAAVRGYADAELKRFGVTFRASRLQRRVDDCDPAVVSNESRFRLAYRWSPRTGSQQTLVFTFANPIVADDDGAFESGPFTYRKNEVDYRAVIRDDGEGTLFLYAQQSDGTRVVLENDVGDVDYASGDVRIVTTVAAYTGYVELSAETVSTDVDVRANIFLDMDDSDVTVTVEATN